MSRPFSPDLQNCSASFGLQLNALENSRLWWFISKQNHSLVGLKLHRYVFDLVNPHHVLLATSNPEAASLNQLVWHKRCTC